MKVMKNVLRYYLRLIALFVLVGLSNSVFSQSVHEREKKQEQVKADFSFAFITDIHISNNLDNIRDQELPLDRKELCDVPFIGFKNALKEIKEHQVDFVLTGGDNIGTETYLYPRIKGKYPVSVPLDTMLKCTKRMHKITSDIDLPIYYANGNHDIFVFPPVKSIDKHSGSQFFAEQLGYEGKAYYSFDKKGWHFIVLNTYDGNKNKFGVSQEQLRWLKKDLKKMRKGSPIVITGHAPLGLRDKYQEGGDAIYKIIKNYDVRLMLFGHFHTFHEYMWNNIPCVIGSSLSGSVWSMVRNIRDIDIAGMNKGVDQGYLIVSVKDGKIDWKHKPYSYSVERYYYENKGKRPVIRY